MTAEVTILGAARTVTGSCLLLRSGQDRILIDCGLFQGTRTIEALNREPFAFDPAALYAVLLTHAHLDHSGLLPRLYASGFRGKICCTQATGDLLEVMLPDAARIHEQDIIRRNRRWDRADEPPLEPLYRLADAEGALKLRTPLALKQWMRIGGVQVRLWNAGHILGSASIEVEAEGTTICFSGDIGPQSKSFHAEPEGPADIDHLFCESTYGDRLHPDVSIEERRSMLAAQVREALERGGNLVIPVFALERTQELLLDLASLINEGRLRSTTVFIDSPLASRATAVFRRHRRELEDLNQGEVFNHPKFHFVESVDESIRLEALSGVVILAASGMCEGGRIRHHLRNNLANANSTVLFVGYQAAGTLGRTIVEGAKRVRISGRDVAVRARIRRLDTYSAHADQAELIAWIRARQPIRGSLFLTHGEQSSLEVLRSKVEAKDAKVVIPEIGERYALPQGEPAKRLETGRTDLRPALDRDWQNEYARLAVNLKRDLNQIGSDTKRLEALAEMRKILDHFRTASSAAPVSHRS